MIRSFQHRGLERYFKRSDHRGIPAQFAARLSRILDRLDGIARPEDMNLRGYRFHPLKGKRRGAYAVNVSGNWRVTFRFKEGDAVDVNLEDYH
jgi:proteic killer suppression protein